MTKIVDGDLAGWEVELPLDYSDPRRFASAPRSNTPHSCLSAIQDDRGLTDAVKASKMRKAAYAMGRRPPGSPDYGFGVSRDLRGAKRGTA